MEAVWTRFFPLVREVRDILRSRKLGAIKRVFADFSFSHDLDSAFPPSHRMVNPDLAGGALLDLGIYSLTWVFMALYEDEDPSVVSKVDKYKTGVDQQSSILLDFGGAHGIATTSVLVASTPDKEHNGQHDVRIQGTLGDLTVNVADKPSVYTLTPTSGGKAGFEYETKTFTQPGGGKGMFWEADECARCIRDGTLESEGMGWGETEAVMRVMDGVRRQGGVEYGEIEKT
jgi:predicted dehydrogenase